MAGGVCGRVKGGRHIANSNATPMANLLVGVAPGAVLEMEQIGLSTGRGESV